MAVDIPRAVNNTYAATRAESLIRYLDVGLSLLFTCHGLCHTHSLLSRCQDVDKGPFAVSRRKLLILLNYTDRAHRCRAFTVDHGDATLS